MMIVVSVIKRLKQNKNDYDHEFNLCCFCLYRPIGKTFLTILEKLSDSQVPSERNIRRESPEFQQLNSAIEEVR